MSSKKTFKLLFSRRTDADYGNFDSADAADAEEAIRLASGAVEEIERYFRITDAHFYRMGL